MSSYKVAAIGQFSDEIADLYVLQRASKAVFISTSADNDKETILNAAIMANYTKNTMPMLVILYDS